MCAPTMLVTPSLTSASTGDTVHLSCQVVLNVNVKLKSSCNNK